MTATFAFTQTVTRLRAPTPDRHGDATGPPAELDVHGCVVWPNDGNGPSLNEHANARRDTTIAGYVLHIPDGTPVARTDQWRVDGQVWEQVGDAAQYASPFTGFRFLVINIRMVTG